MAKCPAIARSGQPCKGLVRAGSDYCPAHDPSRQEARSRAASSAGRAKPSREIVRVRARLSDLADDVLEGRVDRGDAAVVGQLLGTVIRAIATEIKVREQAELEERISALEQAAKERGRASWGA